jgi:hypothetical protein
MTPQALQIITDRTQNSEEEKKMYTEFVESRN